VVPNTPIILHLCIDRLEDICWLVPSLQIKVVTTILTTVLDLLSITSALSPTAKSSVQYFLSPQSCTAPKTTIVRPKPLHKHEVVLCPMPASQQPHKAVTLTGYSTSVRSGPMCAEPQLHCYKPQGLSLTYAALQPPNACCPTNHKVVSITCCSTTTKWHPTHGASHT